MDGLGFIWAYAVMEVGGYDPDAVVQPAIDVDVPHRTRCVCVFWTQSDAEAEARRLNTANASRPAGHVAIHHLVRRTMVEALTNDPRFAGTYGGAVYVARLDDNDLRAGQRRYDCHWETAPTWVWNAFDEVETAIAWGRERAPYVQVTLRGAEHYSAGATNPDDLPSWPPEGWQEP